MNDLMNQTPPPDALAATQEQLRQLSLTLGTARSLIQHSYLSGLDKVSPLPMKPAVSQLDPAKNIRLFQLSGFNYDAQEDILEKARSMYSAIAAQRDMNVFLLLQNRCTGEGDELKLYMGVFHSRFEEVSGSYDLLKRSMTGHFPGCGLRDCDSASGAEVLRDALCADGERLFVSAISSQALPREAPGAQGMERLIDSMSGIPYTLMVLCGCMDGAELDRLMMEYESLYTHLTPLRQVMQTYGTGENENWSSALNRQLSKTLNAASTLTNTTNTSVTKGKTHGSSHEKQDMRGNLVEAGLTIIGGALLPEQVRYAAPTLGKMLRNAAVGPAVQVNESTQDSTTNGSAVSQADQIGGSITEGSGSAETWGGGSTINRSLQLTQENRGVVSLLGQLEQELGRLQGCRGRGAFRCAAYLLTGSRESAETAANIYRALVTGNGETPGVSYINTWGGPAETALLSEYLLRAQHPRFQLTQSGALSNVDPALLASSRELPLHFAWPSKPVPGLEVRRCAEFSRTIPVAPVPGEDEALELGNIFHLGRKEPRRAYLLKQSLTRHVCVAGAPGSGKSNFCYKLLDTLSKDCRFLVIEPAKGNYKDVFGGRPGVTCYGTNPRQGQVLSVNPFAFSAGTSALEHMESLLSILSSCWPLYAAMLDILKDAVIRAYEEAGWDMEGDGLPYDEEDVRFPTFVDLLELLPKVVHESGYAQETKDNYTGSLLTRVKSMTNGINRIVFCAPEVPEERLFQSNVIVDLSHLGADAQALIMGVLVTRLAEFRRSEGGMDRPLHHVTVLEEAHNLLQTDKAVNSGEGAVIGRKSVELLCAAIAEMRSYGEGFLIVDQTPSSLASAVLSNTGTKVAFSLASTQERNVMCTSMELDPAQSEELVELPQGVCVVRGAGWSVPVLMKTDYFPRERFCPCAASESLGPRRGPRYFRGILLETLHALRTGDTKRPGELPEALRALEGSPDQTDRAFAGALGLCLERGKEVPVELLRLVEDVLRGKSWFSPPDADYASWDDTRWEHWDRQARRQLNRRAILSKSAQDGMLELLLQFHGGTGLMVWSSKLGRYAGGARG